MFQQPFQSLFVGLRVGTFRVSGCEMLDFMSVSYTHLDVYKRQHRCRSIPARCRPDKTEKSARSDSRELREPGRCKPEYGKQPSIDLYLRTGTATGSKHRQLPCLFYTSHLLYVNRF